MNKIEKIEKKLLTMSIDYLSWLFQMKKIEDHFLSIIHQPKK